MQAPRSITIVGELDKGTSVVTTEPEHGSGANEQVAGMLAR